MGIAAKAVLLAAARLNAGLSPLTGPPSAMVWASRRLLPLGSRYKGGGVGQQQPPVRLSSLCQAAPGGLQPPGLLPPLCPHPNMRHFPKPFQLALLTRLCLENCILSSASILMIFPAAAASSSSLTVD